MNPRARVAAVGLWLVGGASRDDDTRLVDDTREESIVDRLVKLIEKLQRDHPDDRWGGYLDNGKPKWGRIARE